MLLPFSLSFYSKQFASVCISLTVLQVQRSPVFRRDGADIHSDVMISVAQAILGGTARAQGLYSSIDIAVRK